ncbi:MAG: hypothetical protein M1325_01105 [Actinobacteria bacterium]|nr:hypothetical protein [Actinomycetota bacterium]
MADSVSKACSVPTDHILVDGVAYPVLSEEIAGRIRRIIEEDLEAHPEARQIWVAEAERTQCERKRGAA